MKSRKPGKDAAPGKLNTEMPMSEKDEEGKSIEQVKDIQAEGLYKWGLVKLNAMRLFANSSPKKTHHGNKN